MSEFEVTSRTDQSHKQSNLSIYSPSNSTSTTLPSLHPLPSPPLHRSSIISIDSSRPSDSIDPRPPRIPSGSQVLVTRDSDAAYFVDLSASSSPAAIKERIYGKLGIYDDEHATCRISRSRAGQPIGLPLDDWQLWDLCMRSNQDSDPPMLIVISSTLPITTNAPLSAHSSHSTAHILPPPTSAHRTAIHSPHSPESITHPKYDNCTSSPGRESPEVANSLHSNRSRWHHSNPTRIDQISTSSQSIPNQTSLAPHSHLTSHPSPRSPAFNDERRTSALMAITSSNTPFEIPNYLLPRQGKGLSAENPENWISPRTSPGHHSRNDPNSRTHVLHDRRPSEPAPPHILSPSQLVDGRSDSRVADHPRSRPPNDHIPSSSSRRDMQSAKSMDDMRHHHDHPLWALPGAIRPPLPGAERPPSSNATISNRAPAPLRIPRCNNHPAQSSELVTQRSLQHLPQTSSSRSGPSHPNLAPTVAFPQPTPLRGRTPGTPGYGARPSSSSGYTRAELRGQTVSSARQQALHGFIQHPQPPRAAVPLSNDHRYLEPARNPHWSSETTPSRSTHSLERPMQAPLATQPHIQQAVSHSALHCRPGDVLQDSFQQGEHRRERVRELGPETDQAGVRRTRPSPTPNSSMSASLPPRIRPVSRALNAYSLPPRQPSSPALTNSTQRVDDVAPATQRTGEDYSLIPGRGALRRPPYPHKSASKASSVRSSDSSLHSPLSSRLVTEDSGERGYYHPPRHALDRKSHTRRPNSARSSPSSDCISPATEISLLSSTAGQKARFEDSSSSSLKDLGLGTPEEQSSSQLAYISGDVHSPSGPLVLTPTLLPQRSKENSLRQDGGYGDEGVSTVRADELSKDLADRFSQLQMESSMVTRPSISDTTATRSPTSTSMSNGTWRTSVSSNPTTVHSIGPEIFKNQNPFGIIEDDDDDELVGTFVTPMKPSIVTTTAPSNTTAPLSTGKPKLTLKTDTADERPVRPPRLAPPTNIHQHHSSSTSSSSLMIPSANKRDGDRRTSFTGDDWAVRPAVDEVYEHLEEFFPHHDLDKPIDIGPLPPSSPISPSPSPSPQPSRLNGRARSIRVVAQEKKKLLKRGGPMSSHTLSASDISSVVGNGSQSALLRRKSTKLWGARIEEVVPGSMNLSIPTSIDETRAGDRDEDPDNFSFKWVKGELIGKGSFGQVYLALNATNGEMLAVKQVELPKTRSDRDDERQKSVVAALKSEIHLMRDLEHPNIVQYLGFEETTVYLSIFLEYIPGGSIGRCLRRHGAFELNVIKSFTSQVLEGLKYLHSLHILHRDLKADNLLVDLNGNCKISDFGISKKSDNIYQDNTQMSLQGSIFWMAPEVVHNPGKKGYSAKVDIWSLGCVVLEMFAGRRPWSDEEAIQAMFKLGAERLRPPVPDDVKLGRMSDHFLAQCFIVDPELRPTADRLTDHRFLELDDKTWRFEHSELYRSIRMPGLSAG